MPSNLNPYLSFNGDARKAMEFYQGVLGGELTVNTFGDYGDKDAPEADKIMHAQLETPSGFVLMGADSPPGQQASFGDNVAVSLSGDAVEELRGYWAKLIEGATITVPLEKQMWGDEFGMCIDTFGVHWLVNISSPQS